MYTLFDLEQFLKEDIPEPLPMDCEILIGILAAADSCAPQDYPSALRDKLQSVEGFKSNQAERSVLIEILSCIGVLKPASTDRPTTGRHDWHFVEFWRGMDGYNNEAVQHYFGKYLENHAAIR